MVVRISDKKQNYNNITKLLVKPRKNTNIEFKTIIDIIFFLANNSVTENPDKILKALIFFIKIT